MACKEETTTIDGKEVYCRQMSASQALLFKLKLVKYFGPAFSEVISLVSDPKSKSTRGEKGADTDIDMDRVVANMGHVLNTVFSHAEPEEIMNFIREGVCTAIIDGTRMNNSKFEEVFSGELKTIWKVFFFVLKVNYKDVFDVERMMESLKKKVSM